MRATAAAERAAGRAALRRAALHRAERALADLAALPCIATPGSTAIAEPRWHIVATRDHASETIHDRVTLATVQGDTVALQHVAWCDT